MKNTNLPPAPHGAVDIANNGDNRLMHYQDGLASDIYFQRKYTGGKWKTLAIRSNLDPDAVLMQHEINAMTEQYFD